jgi:hypothetical protein
MREDAEFLQDTDAASSIRSNFHNFVKAIGSAVSAKVTTKRGHFHPVTTQQKTIIARGKGVKRLALLMGLVMRNRGNLDSHHGSPSFRPQRNGLFGSTH